MNANLPEKPNNNNLHSPSPSISRSNSVNSNCSTVINNNNNSSSSVSTVTAASTAAGGSNSSQLLGIINNNNSNNNNSVDTTTSASTAASTTITTAPSLRHQFPPPLPPAPVSSRSPQVNRSTKPNIIISNNSSSSSSSNNNNIIINNNINHHTSSRNNIHSPVTLPALPGSARPVVVGSTTTTSSASPITVDATVGGTTTPTLIFRRRPAVQPVPPLITSVVPTLSSTIQQFDPIPSSPVTLAQPRPENERLFNEYVDTPFTRSAALGRHSSSQHTHLLHQHPHQLNNSSSSNTVNNNSHHHQQQQQQQLHHGGLNTISTIPVPELSSSLLRPNSHIVPHHNTTAPTAITKQPVTTTTFTKDSSTTALTGSDEVDFVHTAAGHTLNSITCPKCNRCRCDGCQRLRPLPSKWMFGDCCYISAESVIDYMSCLCCVKALYYHCSKDHEFEHDSDTSTTCADDPCSCSPHHFASRWGCMAALSFVLPCLLCYWPMRGCAAICSKCYATHVRHGCRCPPGSVPPITSLGQPSKSSGRSISNLLNRNPSTATTTPSINNSHNHAPSSPHQLNDRLLGSSPDY